MITFQTVLAWLLQFAVAFISTLAFSVIFHTPPKQRLFAGLTGAAGWITFIICAHFGIDIGFSSFFAAVVITWLSRIFSFARREPVTSFLICGIFPIVPGAGIYYTGYHLFMGAAEAGSVKGFETIKIAVAIALGIGIILSLPRFPLFTLKKTPPPLSPEDDFTDN